jgi:hypothetical protein
MATLCPSRGTPSDLLAALLLFLTDQSKQEQPQTVIRADPGSRKATTQTLRVACCGRRKLKSNGSVDRAPCPYYVYQCRPEHSFAQNA